MKNLLVALVLLMSASAFAQNETKSAWEESDLIEFVWKTIGEKANFRVCIIGSQIAVEDLESKEVFEFFEKLPTYADAIIVSSKEQQKTISGKVDLKIFLAEKAFDLQYNVKGSFARWQLFANDGEKITQMTASYKPLDLVTPQSERDKLPK